MCLRQGPKVIILAVTFLSINLLRKEVSRLREKKNTFFPEDKDKSSSQENPLTADSEQFPSYRLWHRRRFAVQIDWLGDAESHPPASSSNQEIMTQLNTCPDSPESSLTVTVLRT